MMPKNLLTKKDFYTNVGSTMDSKIVETVSQTLQRAMHEDCPFYFYINQNTIEAKVNTLGFLCVTRVKGAHTIKFKLENVNSKSFEYCAKRVIEVLG